MAIDETPKTSASQGKRRALFGLNVVVAVVAALILVVLLNVLVDWQYRRLPGGLKPLLRYDLTATRAYTLAPQTRKLLADLEEPLRLVAVLRVDDKNSQDVADLLDEYSRYTSRLDVDVIHPDRELARLEAFFGQLESRFAEETAPLAAAIDRGMSDLEELTDGFAELQTTFAELANDEQTAEGELRQGLQVFSNQLGDLVARCRGDAQSLRQELARPLPALSNARNVLLQYFQQIETGVLVPYSRDFARRAEDRRASLKVRNGLLQITKRVNAMRDQIRTTTDALTLPTASTRYDQVSAAVQTGEMVVVLGDRGERVVPIAEMFVSGGPDATGQPTARFVGEDRLTGAMVTMRVAEPPLVVFVRDTPVSMLGHRGALSYVGSRLALADFELTEWNVGGDDQAASEAPRPRAGQKAVYIVPGLGLERTAESDRENVAMFLMQRLAAGDGVLLCFDYDAEALYRPVDPLIELSRTWGVAPRMHEMVLHESLGPDGRTRGEAGWTVRDWPDDSPLGGALDGRQVKLAGVCPIELNAGENSSGAATPLIQLLGDRAWLATEVTTLEGITESRYTEESGVAQPVVAAAAERTLGDDDGDDAESGRLIVFTERHWLSNNLAGQVLGNSELFMNCAYWLAGLDEAVAATPRTQDIRRIDALADGRALTYRVVLLAAVPGLMLLAGAGVWLVRRRG